MLCYRAREEDEIRCKALHSALHVYMYTWNSAVQRESAEGKVIQLLSNLGKEASFVRHIALAL